MDKLLVENKSVREIHQLDFGPPLFYIQMPPGEDEQPRRGVAAIYEESDQ